VSVFEINWANACRSSHATHLPCNAGGRRARFYTDFDDANQILSASRRQFFQLVLE